MSSVGPLMIAHSLFEFLGAARAEVEFSELSFGRGGAFRPPKRDRNETRRLQWVKGKCLRTLCDCFGL